MIEDQDIENIDNDDSASSYSFSDCNSKNCDEDAIREEEIKI